MLPLASVLSHREGFVFVWLVIVCVCGQGALTVHHVGVFSNCYVFTFNLHCPPVNVFVILLISGLIFSSLNVAFRSTRLTKM